MGEVQQIIGFPFLKGRFKRHPWEDTIVDFVKFPFLKGRFKSAAIVAVLQAGGEFPFLKGRFKSPRLDAYFGSRGEVSIPQRKVQKATVSIDNLLSCFRFNSSKEGSKGA